MSPHIPLHRPWIGDEEISAVAEATRRGSLVGNGPFCREAEASLSAILETPALVMSSCTAALEAALMLSGVSHGDEVICPSFMFVSAATAIVRCGATPVFADIDSETYNLDPEDIEHRVTPRTKAILLVHYAGHACDMDRMLDIARRHSLRVIEDAAHALGARLDGRPLGTLGDFGCFSFHGTKDVVCGEGGALVCRRAEDRRLAEAVREKGTNRAQFLRGEVDKYTWVEEGSSYVLSDVLAAMLRVQLSRLPAILARKRELALRLTAQLEPLRGAIQLPIERPGVRSSWHLYAILVPAALRDGFIDALRAEGIGATFHYVSLHSSPFARARFGSHATPLPHTDRLSASLIRLPLFAAMSDRDLEDVARATLKVASERLSRSARL